MRMDQEPDLGDPPLDPPTREEQEAEAWEYWHQRACALEALLRELIDIEGPQPGTSEWARKVQAALNIQIARRKMNDTERLEWLAKQDGVALISDDFGNWAVSFDGFQDIPEDPGTPSDISTSFFIEAARWKPSIREAIDAVLSQEERGD